MDAGGMQLERFPLFWLPSEEARSIAAPELGIAVALFELGLGVVVGNIFELHAREWLDLIALFASIVLTFLAGLEVDPGNISWSWSELRQVRADYMPGEREADLVNSAFRPPGSAIDAVAVAR
jgi:hypothetical protein